MTFLFSLVFIILIKLIRAQDEIIIYDNFGIPYLIFPATNNSIIDQTESKSGTDESTQSQSCEESPRSAAILNYLKDDLTPKLDSIQKSLSDLLERLKPCPENNEKLPKIPDETTTFSLTTRGQRASRQLTTTNALNKQPAPQSNSPRLSLSCGTQLPDGGTTTFTLNGHTFRNMRVVKRTSKKPVEDKTDDSTTIFNKVNQTGLYARFGKVAGDLDLDFTNEISQRVDVELLTLPELNNIKNLFGDLIAINGPGTLLNALIEIDSDLLVATQNIESKNPSFILVRKLENLEEFGKDVRMCLDPKIDSKMTRMSLSPNRLEIKCFGSPFGNSCGHCGLPPNNKFSSPVLLKSIRMDPTGIGASIPDDQWRRNQFILRGRQYSVYVKLLNCPP